MKQLTITISSKTGDFLQALEYITKQVGEGFLRGFDRNEDQDFYYDIEKEA